MAARRRRVNQKTDTHKAAIAAFFMEQTMTNFDPNRLKPLDDEADRIVDKIKTSPWTWAFLAGAVLAILVPSLWLIFS